MSLSCHRAAIARALRGAGTIACLALAPLLVGCEGFIGAGVTAAFVGVAALAMSCDDPVAVTVFDGATGDKTCEAQVTAEDEDGSTRRLQPCYAAALGEGRWTLTATLPGRAPAVTQVIVEHPERLCEPSVHTVELTLSRPESAGRRDSSAGDGAPPTGRFGKPE